MTTDFLIAAGRVITGPGGDRLDDGAVLTSGATITDVGPRGEMEARAKSHAVRVSRPRATLLPGLIDCHVHCVFDGGADPVTTLRESTEADLLLAGADRARQLLGSGVTTVRDLGDSDGTALHLRDAVASGAVRGPRILAAGPPLTPPGGHCWFLGGEVDTDADIRALVRRNAQRGADVVKVMATGGGLTKGGPSIWESQFSPAQLRLVVEEARQAGLPVAAHAHGSDGIAAAVAAGVDTIEHCTWVGPRGFDVREDVVADIVAEGIRVCPAASPRWRDFAERFGPERAEQLFAQVRWMHDQGVRLISGTDAGVQGAGFDDLVSSLDFFRHLGLSPTQIVDMATTHSADALGLGDETGVLAAGRRADLLLVDGDPLSDLDALRDVRLVLAGGHPHTP